MQFRSRLLFPGHAKPTTPRLDMAYLMGKFKVKHPSFHALPDAIQ